MQALFFKQCLYLSFCPTWDWHKNTAACWWQCTVTYMQHMSAVSPMYFNFSDVSTTRLLVGGHAWPEADTGHAWMRRVYSSTESGSDNCIILVGRTFIAALGTSLLVTQLLCSLALMTFAQCKTKKWWKVCIWFSDTSSRSVAFSSSLNIVIHKKSFIETYRSN